MAGRDRVREALRRLHWLALTRLSKPLGEDELRRPAMVFAPHPDDETLGCGGTILRMREAGAPVWISFLTDGAASHQDVVPRAELAALRAREAVEAAEVLGVSAPHVSWLGFPDGELSAHHRAAVARVTALLERYRPELLLLPYARGEHPDHIATNAIVYEAAEGVGLRATFLEYPVWSWRHWPSTSLNGSERERRAVLRGTLSTRFGLRLLAELRTSVPVGELLERKRAALERHGSQVRRREDAPRWPTLADVDGGSFLACFFQEYEVYRRLERASGPAAPRRARPAPR